MKIQMILYQLQLLFKGARMFERHVGIETDQINLNDYSSTPSN